MSKCSAQISARAACVLRHIAGIEQGAHTLWKRILPCELHQAEEIRGHIHPRCGPVSQKSCFLAPCRASSGSQGPECSGSSCSFCTCTMCSRHGGTSAENLVVTPLLNNNDELMIILTLADVYCMVTHMMYLILMTHNSCRCYF